LQAFDFVRAESLQQAIAALAEGGEAARVLSGGTDLLPQLKEGRRRVSLVIDIKHIPELNELCYDPESGLWLGAAVPCYRIYGDAGIAHAYAGLVDSIALIGGVQIQGRASVGGNLCNASPAADSIPALIAHRAVCRIIGPHGSRDVPAEGFCTGPGRTVLGRGELLASVHVPAPGRGFGAAYMRFIPRNEMDIAVTGAGVSVQLDAAGQTIVAARVALGAVAPTPLFVREAGDALAGVSLDAAEAAIEEAARLAQAAARPIDDMRGTVAQRRHLAGVLTRRALHVALDRARASFDRATREPSSVEAKMTAEQVGKSPEDTPTSTG
jgi:CO/xanthine dehydrogenase FAD-binding subunit